MQDISKITNGKEGSIRNFDPRWITGYVEPDDINGGGFMKSILGKLNTTFTSIKI